MNNIFLGLKFALSYFTIIPIKFKDNDDVSKKEVLNYTLAFLPLIGLILALLTLCIYFIFDSIPWLASILAICFYFISYGFIHTEAILDVVDAIYAKHSGKDAYKVIKDPTIGSMGLLYSLVFVIAKIVLFTALLLNHLFFELIAILILSRLALLFNIYYFDFKSTFVGLLKESLSSKTFFYSVLFYALLVLVSTKISYIFLIASTFILSFFIMKFIKKNVGFLNGDALGTSLESLEILLSILVIFLWQL